MGGAKTQTRKQRTTTLRPSQPRPIFVEKFSYSYGDEGVYFKDGKCYMSTSSEGHDYELLQDCYVVVKVDDKTTYYFAELDYLLSKFDNLHKLLCGYDSMAYGEVENEEKYMKYCK